MNREPSSPNLSIVPANGGVTAPLGFRAGAAHSGIKSSVADLDIAVLAANAPVPVAALFTQHPLAAPPVVVSRQHLKATGGKAQAVVVNSGAANACTGPEGLTHAKLMTAEVVGAFECGREEVLVASTGVIGLTLPLSPVLAGVRQALGTMSRDGGASMARAIMTTDHCPKEHAVTVHTSRGPFTVGGTAKGSCMIEPNMATMLGFLTTDAWAEPAVLQRALQLVARQTFNAITVDGECSMNDSLFAFASGASRLVVDAEETYLALVEGFFAVARELAVSILRNGDGAAKVIAVTVSDTETEDDAQRVARAIANSRLVKSAVHRADPNWGPIVAATGRAGVTIDINRLRVQVGGTVLFENGRPQASAIGMAADHLQGESVWIDVSLGSGGDASVTVLACDGSLRDLHTDASY